MTGPDRSAMLSIISGIIAAELTRTPTALRAETRLNTIPGFDSFCMAVVLLELEDRFGLRASRVQIDALKTAGDLADLVSGQPAPVTP